MKKDPEKIGERFEAFIQSQNKKKPSEKNKAILMRIGVERLRIGCENISVTAIYDYVRGSEGYTGTRKDFIDTLAEMGVREKREKPERLNKYKCRAKDCTGDLIKLTSEKGMPLHFKCSICGAIHTKEKKGKILLVRPGTNKQSVTIQPTTQQKAQASQHVSSQAKPSITPQTTQQTKCQTGSNNNQQDKSSTGSSASISKNEFDSLFAKNATGNKTINAMRIEND